MRVCPNCGENEVELEGQTWCYSCHNEQRAKLRRKKQCYVADYKEERGCQRCGEDDVRCLHLHHRNTDDKEYGVCRLIAQGVGWDRLNKEIEKCEVLCANCHWKEHHVDPRVLDDQGGSS